MNDPRHTVHRRHRHPIIATCTAFTALLTIAACGSDDAVSTTETAATEPPATEPETTAPATTEPETREFTPPDSGLNEQIPPGGYEFEFADGVLTVEPSDPFVFVDMGNFIVFDDPANPGGRSDYFAFLRVKDLPTDDGTVPVSEPQAWVDGSTAIVVAESRTEGAADVYRLTSTEGIQVGPSFSLFPGELYELWFVEVAGSDPLIMFGKTTPETPEYLDTLPALASTVTFTVEGADPAPSGSDEALADCAKRPWECGESGEVPAGAVCLPTVGGITFTMSAPRPIEQPIDGDLALVIDPDVEGLALLAIFAPDSTPLGAPIESTEDVVDAHATFLDLEPIDDRNIFGVDTSGYAFEAEELEPAMFVVDGTELVPSGFTQFWTVDADDGPVVVSPAGDSPENLERAVAILDDVATSLSFSDGCPAGS